MSFLELIAITGFAFTAYVIICLLWMIGYSTTAVFGPLLSSAWRRSTSSLA